LKCFVNVANVRSLRRWRGTIRHVENHQTMSWLSSAAGGNDRWFWSTS